MEAGHFWLSPGLHHFFLCLSALSKNECLEILSRAPVVCLGGSWTDLEQWKGKEKVLESKTLQNLRDGVGFLMSLTSPDPAVFFFFIYYFGHGIRRVFIVGRSLLCN